jgi:hypothetical protein
MENLEIYAALADIFGTVTIVTGGIFATVQFLEYRRRTRNAAAAELCRRFAEPELARAVNLVSGLPDGTTLEAFRKLPPEYEQAAQLIGMSFETMGLLVFRNMASFTMIQDLTGGLVLMMWRKIRVWTEDVRREQGAPRFGEWVQWLAERLEQLEGEKVPAYVAHRGWDRHLKQRPGG